MQDPPRSSQRCGQHRPVRGWVDVERRDSERRLQKKVKGGEGLSVGAGTEGVGIAKKLKIKKLCYGAQSNLGYRGSCLGGFRRAVVSLGHPGIVRS